MKRFIFFGVLLILQFGFIGPFEQQAIAASMSETNAMEETWNEFRQIHPYGFQTVALKHVDGNCIFVISEPSESVTETMLDNLFSKYGGSMVVKHQPLGYEGWLGDAVGCIRFANEGLFDSFKHELFMLLYGTDYKAYFTDLDNPVEHVYFSDYRLNYSISAAELSKWFVTDREEFKTSAGGAKTISALLSSGISGTNELFYSKNPGFVVWIVDPGKIKNSDQTFKINARKFALDADLIIGALGNVGKKVAIIARERVVPVTTLPPLRIETIQLLATTENNHLAQSFELHNVFAGKNSKNEDMGPIYLSDELWHTEYGNLLNMTDQMLKSWSENNAVHDYNYDYPVPIDWAFNDGAFKDLNASNNLTYNWNTAGAGYVIQDMDKLDVFAVNRTGSLPVSFIPDGMEGMVEEKVYEAEELAYDFFSELNSPDLVREVQYATIYQIFRYFKESSLQKSFEHDAVRKHLQSDNGANNSTPSFTVYEGIVESLLRLVSDTTSASYKKCYTEGLRRFSEKYSSINAHSRLIELIENDPYGEFKDYLSKYYSQYALDEVLNNEPTEDDIKTEYDKYLYGSYNTVITYINNYKKVYGSFPYQEASQYFVNKRDNKFQRIDAQYQLQIDAVVENYNQKVDKFNQKVRKGEATLTDKIGLEFEEAIAAGELESINKKILENEREASLIIPTISQEKALGSLNWLLTDPGSFEAPIGDFYASKFTSHRQWIKSSPMTKSTIHRVNMYGGHNLNAFVTPIKVSSSKIPKGFCKVSEIRGQKVISVSSADKARVTPDVLRTIERKAIKDEFKLPKAPAERPKKIVLGSEQTKSIRGFDVKQHNAPYVNKHAFVNGKEIESLAQLRNTITNDVIEKGSTSMKEVHFKGYSAREVHAYADDLKECIINRMPEEQISLKNFDINEDIQVISQGDGTVKLVLQQNPETLQQQGICKAAMLNITVPENAGASLKEAIINVFKKSENKINNRFKWKRELRKELQKTHPEIDSYDIKDELIQLYGHIIITNEYEILFEQAA